MKKRLLLISIHAMVFFTGYTQSLSLSNQNGPIVSNSIIIQAGTPDSVTLNTYIDITNTGNAPLNVLCRKTELNMIDSTRTFICWANFCYAPHIFITPTAQTIGSGETYTGFKGIYAHETYNFFSVGESVVRWTFYNQDNINDSVCVTVRYPTYPVNIGELDRNLSVLSVIYPNPASGIANAGYTVPRGSRGSILIRDVVGNVVQTHLVPAGTGKVQLNVSELSEGVYFCSLVIDGRPAHTRKLVVRH
jgi:hypothetical protein